MKFLDKVLSVFEKYQFGHEAKHHVYNFPKEATNPNPSAGFRYGNEYASTTSGGAKYPYGLSSSAPNRTLDHLHLRQQARDAYHDTPQAKMIVDRFADTVVDVGLKLELNPKSEILGISDEKLEAWAQEVESRFDLWAKSKSAHRAKNMNFYQAQRLYAIQQQRDNDQFVRLFYSKEKTLLNPLQFEIYDPNQIRGYSYTSIYGQSNTHDGIERNADGSEKSYKIWYQDPVDGSYKYETVERIGKSGLPHMLHGFYSEYSGQRRGYSRIGHALQEFENITDFSVASIKKAINMSSIIMAVENSQQAPSNPFEEIARTQGGAGPAAQQFGSKSIVSDTATTRTDKIYNEVPNYTPIPELTLSRPGSAILASLAKGDTIRELGQGSGADQYDKFVDAFTAHLAASVGMPIELALLKFQGSYSAARACLIMFWRIAQIWQHEMASDLLNPIFNSWLHMEIAAGRISAPGWSDPIMQAAWTNCNWIGVPMPNIDPNKTAKADKLYVEMGAQTIERVSKNLNGSNAKSNMRKLKREYEQWSNPPWNTDWAYSDAETNGGSSQE